MITERFVVMKFEGANVGENGEWRMYNGEWRVNE
jgi:hypothetical protein